jgi:hypothetical protein
MYPIAIAVRRLKNAALAQRPPGEFLSILMAGFSFGVSPQGLQKHACHVGAGCALIPDHAGLTHHRDNPHHLVHYGFVSRTCKALALWKVRHATCKGFKCTPPVTTRQFAMGLCIKEKALTPKNRLTSAARNPIVFSLFPPHVITVGHVPTDGGRMQKTRRPTQESVRKERISRRGAWLAPTCGADGVDGPSGGSPRPEDT